MSKKEKVFLDWTADHRALVNLFEVKSPEYLLRGLMAKLHGAPGHLAYSGVSQALLVRQAQSLEANILFVPLPELATDAQSVSAYQELLRPLQKKGLSGLAFGNLEPEKEKAFQEKLLSGLDLKAFYPLAGWGSQELMRVFFSLGYRAIVTSVDLKKLPPPFVGRELDREFIDSLPSGIDPAGQNNEFSCFVYDGPFFQKKLELQKGSVSERDGRAWLDLE